MPAPSIFSSSLILLLFTLEAAAVCYWRNGGVNNNPDYRPCNLDAFSTTCCAVWDDCLINGLCRQKNEATAYWRESCTLNDWASGGCQDICSTDGDDQKNDVRVTPCDGTANSTTWCCGETTDCCSGSSSRYTIAPTFVGSVKASSLSISSSITTPSNTQSTTQTTSSSTSPTASPTSTETPSNTSSSGLSTGAKAGIGVGAALGVIALVALGWFIGRRTHKKKQGINPYAPETAHPPPKYEHQAAPVGELPGDQLQPHELSGRREA